MSRQSQGYQIACLKDLDKSWALNLSRTSRKETISYSMYEFKPFMFTWNPLLLLYKLEVLNLYSYLSRRYFIF